MFIIYLGRQRTVRGRGFGDTTDGGGQGWKNRTRYRPRNSAPEHGRNTPSSMISHWIDALPSRCSAIDVDERECFSVYTQGFFVGGRKTTMGRNYRSRNVRGNSNCRLCVLRPSQLVANRTVPTSVEPAPPNPVSVA